jgi:hypothetical protein
MQHRLKSPARPTRARIIPSELLDELLTAMHDAIAALDVRLGWEPLTPFATDLESTRIRDAHV